MGADRENSLSRLAAAAAAENATDLSVPVVGYSSAHRTLTAIKIEQVKS